MNSGKKGKHCTTSTEQKHCHLIVWVWVGGRFGNKCVCGVNVWEMFYLDVVWKCDVKWCCTNFRSQAGRDMDCKSTQRTPRAWGPEATSQPLGGTKQTATMHASRVQAQRGTEASSHQTEQSPSKHLPCLEPVALRPSMLETRPGLGTHQILKFYIL